MPERKTSVDEAAARLTQPFTHTILGQVDDYCAYLSRFLGSYRFHQHAKDEMYYGASRVRSLSTTTTAPVSRCAQGETLVVRAGERHRSRAEKEALVLLFKAAHLFAE